MNQVTEMLNRYPWAERLFDKAVHILAILAFVVICSKLIRIICAHVIDVARKTKPGESLNVDHEKRLATVTKIFETTMRVALYVLALLMILREVGLDIAPLLAGAGIAGVAIGFGAQSLVKDMIAGLFLLIENQIRIGDVIRISGMTGMVERMELRITAIRDGDGTLHIIPNGEIKAVSNMTYKFASAIVPVYLPYKTDLQQAAQVLETIANEFEEDPKWKGLLRSKPAFSGVTEFRPTDMMLQLSVKTEPHSRADISNELRRRIKLAFEKANIPLPEIARA